VYYRCGDSIADSKAADAIEVQNIKASGYGSPPSRGRGDARPSADAQCVLSAAFQPAQHVLELIEVAVVDLQNAPAVAVIDADLQAQHIR
jgi:hypothetical protein